jgi:acetyltransferase EpsM
MILYGASGHAKVIIDILKKMGTKMSTILDDDINVSSLNGYAVDHTTKFKNIGEDFIVSIGDNRTRKRVVDRNSFSYGIAIHPKSIIDDTSKVDFGSVVMAGVIINANTKIGKHCIINTSASIDHDCVLKDFVHISPNATLCGGIKIGEGTQVGAGAVIIPNLKIGKWCTIGAGAVVISDVPDGATVVGNPGRIINTKI